MSDKSSVSSPVADEVKSAHLAGLRYSMPGNNGIHRKRSGSGFIYLDADGKRVTAEETLARIRSLVLPPAWTSVSISSAENTHIQAIGRDARGRKQYRYHPKYRHVRDLIKFDRMLAFGKALPKIRRVVSRDLGLPGMPKRRVLAAVVKLLETTYIRIGNEEYVEENNSYGLTTLRNQHVQVLGDTLKFRFKGKSHQHHEITLEDKRLANIIRNAKKSPAKLCSSTATKTTTLRQSSRATSTTIFVRSAAESLPPRISAPGAALVLPPASCSIVAWSKAIRKPSQCSSK